MAEVAWELLCLRTHLTECQWIWRAAAKGLLTNIHSSSERPRRISRQKFPKRTRILSIPSKPYSFHSAIGSRINGMIFRKRNSFQKNTKTVHSEYSYCGIVPKECALSKQTEDKKSFSVAHLGQSGKVVFAVVILSVTLSSDIKTIPFGWKQNEISKWFHWIVLRILTAHNFLRQ